MCVQQSCTACCYDIIRSIPVSRNSLVRMYNIVSRKNTFFTTGLPEPCVHSTQIRKGTWCINARDHRQNPEIILGTLGMHEVGEFIPDGMPGHHSQHAHLHLENFTQTILRPARNPLKSHLSGFFFFFEPQRPSLRYPNHSTSSYSSVWLKSDTVCLLRCEW